MGPPAAAVARSAPRRMAPQARVYIDAEAKPPLETPLAAMAPAGDDHQKTWLGCVRWMVPFPSRDQREGLEVHGKQQCSMFEVPDFPAVLTIGDIGLFCHLAQLGRAKESAYPVLSSSVHPPCTWVCCLSRSRAADGLVLLAAGVRPAAGAQCVLSPERGRWRAQEAEGGSGRKRCWWKCLGIPVPR